MGIVTVSDDARLSLCLSLCRDGEIFRVFDPDGELVSLIAANDPVREIARIYLRNGAPADTPLQVRHCNSDQTWITTTVGIAAETVEGATVVSLIRKAVRT